MSIRVSWVGVGGLLIACSLGPKVSTAQDKDLRILGVDERVAPARFHSLVILTGFGQQALSRNFDELANVFTAFNTSFRRLHSSLPPNAELMRLPTPVDSPGLTWERVLNEIESLEQQVETDHVVFCYVLAHGKPENNDLSLQFAAGQAVPRTALVKRFKELQSRTGARLVVLITDNCWPPGDKSVQVTPTPASGKGAIWRALYFGHHGFVDLVSTTETQRGYVVGNVSVFNSAFSDALSFESNPDSERLFLEGREDDADKALSDAIDDDDNDLVSWVEFADHLQAQLSTNFSEKMQSLSLTDPNRISMANQKGQTLRLIESGVEGFQPSIVVRNR